MLRSESMIMFHELRARDKGIRILNPIIAGHPQSVKDNISNGRIKNSLMGAQ